VSDPGTQAPFNRGAKRSYREHILTDAAKDLAQRVRRRPGQALEIYRRFRKIEEHRLRLWHNAGGGGRQICRQRSELTDILFREIFLHALEAANAVHLRDDVVAIAFGGYGRREMNPFSDVDLMFIHDGRQPPPEIADAIRGCLTILWDLGLKVGHSTRSIPQAIKQANEDPLTKTSMLEARYLLGKRALFQELKERFEKQCVDGKEDQYIRWRMSNQDEMREKYGQSVFMQEPNVKNGRGGLRDYHSLLWVAWFRHRIPNLTQMVERGYLRESERRNLDKAYDFLVRVRTELHYQNGRANDSLTLLLQGKVANAFKYPQKHILGRVEAFMRDYYQQTRTLSKIVEQAYERLGVPEITKPPKPILSLLTPKKKRVTFDKFYAIDGKIYAQSRHIFNEDPHRMMRLFQHAQLRKLELSAELKDLVQRRLRLVNREFQYNRRVRETFLAILSRKGDVGRTLRMMHEVDFLGRFMPEFGNLTCLVQHEFFHRYTADEHTLVCIEKLDEVLLTENPKLVGYRSIFQKLEDPTMLYLAVLLHDTGKSQNRRHHEDESALNAQKVSRRLLLSSERRQQLILLVHSHYELSHTSQTRNLDDPATIEKFASAIKTRPNLDALMLLTLADGMGTSDAGWSDWKEGLVWALYRRTCSYFESGSDYLETFHKDRRELRELARKKLPRAFTEEIEAHFEHMPDRYFSANDPEEMVGHLKLFRQFFENRKKEGIEALKPAIKWIPRKELGHTEVWICGWDRHGFLARIAGSFLAANLNILSADAYTRGDSLALDIFRVRDSQLAPVTSQRELQRVEKFLADSLEHPEFDFRPMMKEKGFMRSYRVTQQIDLPTRISIQNSLHPLYTIVEIQTPDHLGLLYNLLRCLSDANVNIELSRITTEMEVAIDTFYITDAEHNKVEDDDAILDLQKRLHDAATGEG